VDILFTLSETKEIVPIEDWISTVSFLIGTSVEGTDIHSTIHTISMASTTPSHVTSLIEEGILKYWERVLSKKNSCVGVGVDSKSVHDMVRKAISYLTSIDNQLHSKVHFLLREDEQH
jgi:hypothetical protein